MSRLMMKQSKENDILISNIKMFTIEFHSHEPGNLLQLS